MDMTSPTTSVVPDSRGINIFTVDEYARDLFSLYLPTDLNAFLQPHFERLGLLVGGTLNDLANSADKNPPTLSVRTRSGVDESRVIKHPDYVAMERLAYGDFGLAAMSHRSGVLGWPSAMPPAAKYALTYLFVQAEFGLCCPVSMTDSLARTLKKFGDPKLVERFLPMLTSLDFDELKQGAMFMTEQGAGSDVSATEVEASLQGDGRWALSGDKWFCSNPDAGFAMVLARSEPDEAGLKGISLFLLPRDLEDGSHNHYRILRLKDKLGTRSMASGEIRLEGAKAWLIGERGQGFKLMTDMINNSRLSNGVRAAGLMRRALTEALFVAQHRSAFGKHLIELPLMQRQLLKMLVWTEQARTMVFQTAKVLQAADEGDANSKKLARIMTPLFKFRACRDARKVTGDAMEVRGGCGYIEEWPDARLLRDAHLGSIWEGTSNIVALDVQRAIQREECLPALYEYVRTLLDGVLGQEELIARIHKVFEFARQTVELPHLARQSASALYHAVTAAGLLWESKLPTLSKRGLIAELVFKHRLAVRDPLDDENDSYGHSLVKYGSLLV
jgi:acyl-CoA dehydrogenase